MFREAGFKLYKQHQNDPALEGTELVNETDQTFEKQQLGMKLNQMKTLGLI